MKPAIPLAILACFSLSGCALLYGGNTGNPYGDAYAGSPDSIYDAKVNPPQTIGAVTYDPSAPQPTPAGMDLPKDQ